MTVSLSVAVMAHPKRAEMVDDLLDRLDAPASVVWDEINNRHDTGVRSLEAFDPGCTHHMVIQDDALPCRDLIAGVTRAIVHVPDGHPLSCYVGRVRPFASKVERLVTRAHGGVSFLRMEGIYWGPCIVTPTGCLPELTRWFRANHQISNYDRRTSRWFEQQGRGCWYTWPSLVDHRGDDSLTHGHTGQRRAHRALGPDASALDLDWSGEALSLPDTLRMDVTRQRNAQRRAMAGR